MSAANERGPVSAAPAARAFRAHFGGRPHGVWSAPGRVNLIGEHVDYNEGLVLPIALPQRTFAAMSRTGQDLLRVHSVQTGETVQVELGQIAPGRPGGWAAYVAGVVWSLRASGYAVAGLDVAIDSTVPVGAGLSSSAALECAVAAGASDLFDLGLLGDDAARAHLAALCVRAENDLVGAPTGGMDQSAALLCRAGAALVLDCRDGSVEHVPLELSGPRAGGDWALLVTDTRAHHALVDGQYADRRRACERASARLGLPSLRHLAPADLGRLEELSDPESRRRARHVVTEIDRVRQAVAALRAGDLTAVGALLDASHVSLRDDFEVSCPELDVAVESARGAGAIGARMTGGGFGGSTISLCPRAAAPAVTAAIGEAFAARGWVAPRCFTVEASAGARRE